MEKDLCGFEFTIVIVTHCKSVCSCIVNYKQVAHLDLRKVTVDRKFVVILAERSCDVVEMIAWFVQDMRLRMKYVDIPTMLEADVEKAIRSRVADGTGNLYVLVNYTALFSTRNILKKLEGEQK